MGFIIVLIVIVIVIVIYFVVKSGTFEGTGISQTETPLEVLKKRYAKGEISKEAFDIMKKDLEN